MSRARLLQDPQEEELEEEEEVGGKEEGEDLVTDTMGQVCPLCSTIHRLLERVRSPESLYCVLHCIHSSGGTRSGSACSAFS